MTKNILITGGSGFIGSNLVRYFVHKYRAYNIYNLDSLTYAGNSSNLKDLKLIDNYHFIQEDITNTKNIISILHDFNITDVIHLAAESHVDNSIKNPFIFCKTNVQGTLSLLHSVESVWKKNFHDKLFIHVSTDEVFGSLNKSGKFNENSKYNPQSPYSASKAASDHFVKSYLNTYNLPVIVTNCSNNFGPYQHPEKLIPLFIHNIVNGLKLPIYGNGSNIRDWIYVDDHVSALDKILHYGQVGESYCIGGSNEISNLDLTKILISMTDKILGNEKGHSLSLIEFVDDRPGHDFRYSINSSKIRSELKWQPLINFENGIDKTINWYLNNIDWTKNLLK
mgnify:CR=1 FL=1|tara:strand:- start:5922 stop:6935 length:1014 start_codon:yes stop_codon:yes gene_type:complete